MHNHRLTGLPARFNLWNGLPPPLCFYTHVDQFLQKSYIMQARSNLQRTLGRPVALDEASGMTIGDIKALEGSGDDGGDVAAADDSAPAPAAEESDNNRTAPLIHPAKLIDLQRDLPVELPNKLEVPPSPSKHRIGREICRGAWRHLAGLCQSRIWLEHWWVSLLGPPFLARCEPASLAALFFS